MADFDSCDIHFDKKEFSIVGDALYLRTLEEAPLWLKTAIENEVDINNSDFQTELQNFNYNLIAAANQLDIAKNTYDSYINKLITDEAAFLSRMDTLQTTVNNNDAAIRNLLVSYATEDFAVATATNTINASLNSTGLGTIGAAISNAENALATQYGTLAQRLNTLESTYEFIDEDVTGTANAVQDLKVYTGYGTVGGTPALISESAFYTELNNDLTSIENSIVSNTDSILGLDNRVTVNEDGISSVGTSFFYDSVLKIGSQYHYSGFGLESTGYGTGTELDPFSSEFWVNAQRFKFTNDNKSGGVAPFSIDSSGTTPQIRFDGIVDFTNTNASSSNSTILNGSKIATGSIDASKIDVNSLFAQNISATGTISGGALKGTTIDGGTLYGTIIRGSVIDGGLIIGGTDMTMPTDQDNGAGSTRYLCSAGASWSKSLGTASGWRRVAGDMKSAGYTAAGTTSYDSETVYTDFNRYYVTNISPLINMSHVGGEVSVGDIRGSCSAVGYSGGSTTTFYVRAYAGGTLIYNVSRQINLSAESTYRLNWNGGVLEVSFTRVDSCSAQTCKNCSDYNVSSRYTLKAKAINVTPAFNYTGNGALYVEGRIISTFGSTINRTDLSVQDSNGNYL